MREDERRLTSYATITRYPGDFGDDLATGCVIVVAQHAD
jgi:hypothetical protein